MFMAKKHVELIDSEWAILEVVWEIEPCTAPTVQEALVAEKGWAYTTVKTMMDRMVNKGLLKTEKIRKMYLYQSAITRKKACKGEIAKTVKRAFSGALTPMMQFVLENETLSEDEYQHLEDLIKHRKRTP
jgi:BlaI family penicillinase repressor